MQLIAHFAHSHKFKGIQNSEKNGEEKAQVVMRMLLEFDCLSLMCLRIIDKEMSIV